jgi:hypothetical protein
VPVALPQVDERVELAQHLVLVVAGEGDEQQRGRVADETASQVGVLDLLPGQVEDRLVHELDLRGLARQRVGGRLDRLLRRLEVPDGVRRVLRLGTSPTTASVTSASVPSEPTRNVARSNGVSSASRSRR